MDFNHEVQRKLTEERLTKEEKKIQKEYFDSLSLEKKVDLVFNFFVENYGVDFLAQENKKEDSNEGGLHR